MAVLTIANLWGLGSYARHAWVEERAEASVSERMLTNGEWPRRTLAPLALPTELRLRRFTLRESRLRRLAR